MSFERYTVPIHESFRIGGLHGPLGPHRRQEASDVRSATAQRRRRSDSFCHCVSDRESSPLACHANGKLKSRAVVRKAMLVRHRTRMDSSQDESIKARVHIHIKKTELIWSVRYRFTRLVCVLTLKSAWVPQKSTQLR